MKSDNNVPAESLKKVPIIVLEDKPLIDDARQWLSILNENPIAGFQFVTHPCCMKRIQDNTTFQRFVAYLSGVNDSEWGELEGPAILIADLGYTAVDLANIQDAPEFLDDWQEQRETLHPSQWQGLFLVKTALENKRWEGVLCIATGLGHNPTVESVVDHYCNRRSQSNVLWTSLGGGLSESLPKNRLPSTTIQPFIERFGNIEFRLWPESSRMWFSRNTVASNQNEPLLPHDPHSTHEEKLIVGKYIESVLGFGVPKAWFEEGQYNVFYTVLKELTGACCGFNNGDSSYPLGLGAFVLLLAAGQSRASERWLTAFNWPSFLPKGTEARTSIISPKLTPEQSTEECRIAAHAIIDLGKALIQESGEPLSCIQSVEIKRWGLEINLYIPPNSLPHPLVPALVKMKDGGALFDTIMNTWTTLSMSKDGNCHRMFTISVLPSGETNSLLELRLCRRV